MKKLWMITLAWLLVSGSAALASFNNNSDGTITDTDTGLIWEEATSGPMTWEEALSYCEGQDGWRLPTLKELDSITDLTVFGPAINTFHFEDTESDNYWTATTYDGERTRAWVMNFNQGDDGTLDKLSTAYVRAVKGGAITPQPPGPYTDNGNGTITDSRTGLVWQKLTDQDEPGIPLTTTWQEALARCDVMTLGGQTDWRLPTLKELDSITDLAVFNPSIDTRFFPDTQSDSYWTATTDDGTRTKAWVMNFNNGDDGTLDKLSTAYIRAVRGGQISQKPAGRFVDNGNGTITDRNTGLTWEKQAETAMNWEAALAYCDDLDLVERGEWRLPTLKELDSITDLAVFSPAIDTRFFPDTQSENYWTATTDDGTRTKAWVMNFNHGDDGTLSKTEEAYVRAVLDGEAGTPGVLDHFNVSNVSGTQNVGDSFEVTIRAVDVYNQTVTSFNGEVILTTDFGLVDPYRVTFENGQWDGYIKALSPGEGRLRVNGSAKGGVSEPFKVTGEGQNAGIVQGVVYGTDGVALSDATVFLQNGSELLNTTSSKENGSFEFTGLSYGEYQLRATFGESAESDTVTVRPQFNACVFKSLYLHSKGNPLGLTPILLVPGMMGSSIGGGGLKPILPKESPDWNDSRWTGNKTYGLHDPANQPGWENLIKVLKLNGYEMNTTLFAVPNDWRKDLGQIAQNYLKKKIDLAREKAGTDKVHIIAHSMGGLITRWYIQSDYYDKDIDRFAMVGTPNHGSANAYYMWFGGDPKTADDITSLLNLYSKTTERLYEDMNEGERLFPIGYNAIGVEMTVWDDPNAMRNAQEFYKNNCPGLRTLLPVYDFLNDGESDFGVSTNQTLRELNERFTIRDVTACIFLGNEKKTIQTIYVGAKNEDNDRYPHGTPMGDPDRPESGDGTVLETSAKIGSEPVFPPREEKHTNLLNEYRYEVKEFIKTGDISLSQFSLKTSEETSSAEPELSIHFIGKINPYVISPSNEALGIDPTTEKPENSFADAHLTMDGGYTNMTLTNPVAGVYEVTLKAGIGTQCRLNVGYVDESVAADQSRILMLQAGATQLSFTLYHSGNDPLVIENTPAIPQDVFANAVEQTGLKTRIEWSAPDDASITEYRVYGRKQSSPLLSLLGTTSVLSFDTGDDWAASDVIPTRVYAVSSVNADGKESFLSPLIKNNDRDHDGLTDAEETEQGTELDNPDSDGDGLTDGEEVARGTKPLVQDTDEDGFSDYVEIQAGSDPLNDQSVPQAKIPTVSTAEVTNITLTTATSGGTVTDDGWAEITARGVCWSTLSNPTISDKKTVDGAGLGAFTSAITGLAPEVPYHVRAYATNSAGTGYGEDVTFSTAYASTLYVKSDGACSGLKPCYTTIQTAIDAAAAGTLIKVAAGSYPENPQWQKEGMLTISGGWNGTFTDQSSESVIYAPATGEGAVLRLLPRTKVVSP